MSLLHGGPAPHFLAPVLIKALVRGPEKTKVPIDLVPDGAVTEVLIKVWPIPHGHITGSGVELIKVACFFGS